VVLEAYGLLNTMGVGYEMYVFLTMITTLICTLAGVESSSRSLQSCWTVPRQCRLSPASNMQAWWSWGE
jgi:hypothetical protein